MKKIESRDSRLNLLARSRYLAAIRKEYDKALLILEKLLAENNADLDVLRLKANILDLKSLDSLESSNCTSTSLENGFETAKSYYDKILTIDPNNPPVLLDLGDYFSRKGDHTKALELFDRAISLLKAGHFWGDLEEEFEEAYFAKIELLETMGKKTESIECLAEARKNCPKSHLFSE